MLNASSSVISKVQKNHIHVAITAKMDNKNMKWGKLVKESRIQFQENGKKVFFSLIGKLHIYRKKLKNDQITNRVNST